MKILLIQQPYLTKYRLPVFEELAKDYKTYVLASMDKSYGVDDLTSSLFTFIEAKEVSFFNKKFFWQEKLVSTFLQKKPDVLFLSANPRYISNWVLLLLSIAFGTKVVLHGQGFYDKDVGFFRKSLANLYSFLCHQYLCYTDTCKISLKGTRLFKKSVTVENSIVNNYPVCHKTINTGILYIGRLREGSNLKLLLEIMPELNRLHRAELFVVGDGADSSSLIEQYKNCPFIHFEGEIYDGKTISEISEGCCLGCYPGNAGLSVLHFMSLSLPPVIHSSLREHMGPEPSYVNHEFDGFYFEKGDKDSLFGVLHNALSNKKNLEQMQLNAFKKYKTITEPSLASRIKRVLSNQ
ncbi:glycosyltransferase family 1 protein [Alteromonas sediminis]|uniref:Glycosyltransferase family 1 protein n=1 Tax=Alteromonas sediminis TaxID=2259342 RepID=A0A3N5ZE18_9ALTE|nr:glycosyltransferase [Alteromonas sediminis]RPJ68508.1 glycosyltransferase family 1 protein [Alteromonas sediminis]